MKKEPEAKVGSVVVIKSKSVANPMSYWKIKQGDIGTITIVSASGWFLVAVGGYEHLDFLRKDFIVIGEL